MEGRFGYCDACKNKGMCANCYRGSHYEHDWNSGQDRSGQYGPY